MESEVGQVEAIGCRDTGPEKIGNGFRRLVVKDEQWEEWLLSLEQDQSVPALVKLFLEPNL